MSALFNNDNPYFSQLEAVLKRQSTANKNAYKRKGERPRDIKPRSASVAEYEMAVLSNRMQQMQTGGGHRLMTTVIGNPYPPSVADFRYVDYFYCGFFGSEVGN